MNTAVLIEALVRQTTVLIATLATAAGQRATLSRIADQVFADLVQELNDQGVGHKVIADMFGMALRTYHDRVARVAASRTDQGRSLWEAVLTHAETHGPITRAQLLERFVHDDDATVRGVLRDLVESRLLYQTGRGDETTYRVADPREALGRNRDPQTLERLVQVAIYRHGPLERTDLEALIPVDHAPLLDACLERLAGAGDIAMETTNGGTRYHCETCIIRFGDPVGWEAAVFDHYQAMVSALVTKLRLGKRRADLSDRIGGSTFVFDLSPDHPLAGEILEGLQTLRKVGMDLRRRLEEYDRRHPPDPTRRTLRVVSYVGQTVQEGDADEPE